MIYVLIHGAQRHCHDLLILGGGYLGGLPLFQPDQTQCLWFSNSIWRPTQRGIRQVVVALHTLGGNVSTVCNVINNWHRDHSQFMPST